MGRKLLLSNLLTNRSFLPEMRKNQNHEAQEHIAPQHNSKP